VAHSTRIAGCAETYEKRQIPTAKGKPESPLEPKNSSTVTKPEKRQAFGAVECSRVVRDGEDGCIEGDMLIANHADHSPPIKIVESRADHHAKTCRGVGSR
jgi:hypothetical protein